MKILIFVVIFLYVFFFCSLAADYNKNRALIEQNFIWLLVIAFLLVGLAEWALVPPVKGSANENKFEAVVNNEVQHFKKCKKENGYKVCEAASGKEVVVDDFWKK